MRRWIHDVSLAGRVLRKRAGFSAITIATLALSVGTTTALFGAFRAVVLEPVPLPDPGQLVIVMEEGPSGCCGPASGPDYLDWRQRNRVFSEMAALNTVRLTLTGASQPLRIYGTEVTASVFPMLGTPPLMGRALLPEDQDGEPVVVLSYSLWHNRFGGDPDILGRELGLSGTLHTVVGVMPEGFDVPSPWGQLGDFELYLPLDNALLHGERASHSFPVLARVAAGQTTTTAQLDMDRVMTELAAEYPQTIGDRGARVFTVAEYLYGPVGTQLGMILGASGLVLLIACENVAGLLLARAAGRETELAVRAALGASRRALVRLVLSEALTLAALGGLLGLAIAYMAVDGLKLLLPPTIPRIGSIAVDSWAFVFALTASGLTVVLFGLAPALLASRTNLAATVREGGASTVAPTRERLRASFIVAQIALGLVLANAATLLVRSYTALRGEDFGFDGSGVVTLALDPGGPRYEGREALARYYEEVVRQAGEIPGVESVGTVSRLPLFGGSNANVWIEGTPPRQNSGEGPLVEVTSVTGDYFEAMRIPLLAGRLLQPDDSTSTAPGVVINQEFAELAWPSENPIGRRFSFTDNPPSWYTVVGVVGDVRQWGPDVTPRPQMYGLLVRGWATSAFLTIRTRRC